MSANLVFGLFTLVMALVILFIGVKWLLVDRQSVALSRASVNWARAPGRIDALDVFTLNTASDADTNQTYLEPRVAYSFTIADQSFSGTKIGFDRSLFSSEKRAKARIAAWKAGDTVEISYDPADPGTSVLDSKTMPPQVSFRTGIFLICGLVLIPLGIFLMELPA